MPDIEEAVRSLLTPPLSPATPVDRIERRALALTWRRRVSAGAVAILAAVALFSLVVPDDGQRTTRVASGADWRTFENHGLVVRYPPGWVVVTDDTSTSVSEVGVSENGEEYSKDTVIPSVTVASRPIRPSESNRSDEDYFPNDIVVFSVGDGQGNDEVGPGDGTLGPVRRLPNGVRKRVGQASSMFDMVAMAGVDAPQDQWALVERIAESVRVPVLDLEEGGPSMSELRKAEGNARMVVAQASRSEETGIQEYSLLVGDRCFKVRADPAPGSNLGGGTMHGRCFSGLKRPQPQEVKLLWSTLMDGGGTLVAVRAGSDILRIAGEQADGKLAPGVISAKGWGLVLNGSGLTKDTESIIGSRIVKVLAYDAKNELVWSGSLGASSPE